MALRRWAIYILTATAFVVGSAPAWAGGRAFCRGTNFGITCAAEQTLWTLFDSLEVAAGVEYRYPEGATPYTAVLWFGEAWWAGLEIANMAGLGGRAWRWAFTAGVRW